MSNDISKEVVRLRTQIESTPSLKGFGIWIIHETVEIGMVSSSLHISKQ